MKLNDIDLKKMSCSSGECENISAEEAEDRMEAIGQYIKISSTRNPN